MPKEQKPTHLGHRARIKNKFLEVGLSPFLDHEVLELLLTYAIPRKDTKPLAWKLIKRFGSLVGALDAPQKTLEEVEGLGPQSAILLKVVREVITRYSFARVKGRLDIHNQEELYNYCRAHLQCKKEEFFEVLFLDIKSRLIVAEILAEGAVDHAMVDPRRLVGLCIQHGASYIICIHNHPSGDPTPSMEDSILTQKLKDILKPLDIKLVDHIIVGAGKIYSLESRSFIEGSKIIL